MEVPVWSEPDWGHAHCIRGKDQLDYWNQHGTTGLCLPRNTWIQRKRAKTGWLKTNMQPVVDHLCKSLLEAHVALHSIKKTLVIKWLIAAVGVFLSRMARRERSLEAIIVTVLVCGQICQCGPWCLRKNQLELECTNNLIDLNLKHLQLKDRAFQTSVLCMFILKHTLKHFRYLIDWS